MRCGIRSGASWIASEPPEVQAEFLDDLDDGVLLALPYMFEFWAMEHQLPPEGDWTTWVVMGGRGAGKTRAGAEWVRSEVEGPRPLDQGRSRRMALIGETLEQSVAVMVEGESGILACSPPDRRPHWDATRKRLSWPNGAEARVFSAHDPERLRGPQFDAAWVDEFGCPAIDKGSNEPNRFVDPKSSESARPLYSNGQRDDLIQMQYLRAVPDYWSDPARNPISAIYGGPMLDMEHAYVWAWDTRPFPYFPANTELWSDGDNYAYGHWISGRTSARSLASVVAEICDAAGLADYDVSALHGIVRGYAPGDVSEARALLQPLMTSHGFDAAERGGKIVFRSRGAGRAMPLIPDAFAALGDVAQDLTLSRASPEDSAGRIRLNYVEAEGDFAVRTAEAGYPDVAVRSVAQSDLAVALTGAEALQIAERWMAETRVARDRTVFSVAHSRLDLGPGDLVSLPGAGQFRIDTVEVGEARTIEATRVEPGIYAPSEALLVPPQLRPFVPPLPVDPVFLDLPLLRGDEDPVAPHVAVAADPWSSVAIYASGTGESYELNTLIESPVTLGVTESDLPSSAPGVWDRGPALRVRLHHGALSSATDEAVLAGANAMAIGDGLSDAWEVFQFAEAELVAPGTYEVRRRLRGQAGTDGLMPVAWPAGSKVVLLDNAAVQIELPDSALGLLRHYRVGPARRPPEDATYRELHRAFEGAGLRPYAPAHLAARRQAGNLEVSWIRRTRIDGDRWGVGDVPLGEASERYVIRVLEGAALRREVEVNSPRWTYSASDQVQDGVAGPFSIAVAQISDRVGPGLFRRIEISE